MGYIYVRRHPSYDIARKLGKASNVPDRDSVYMTGELIRGKFEAVYEIDSPDIVERLLQDEFSELNIYIDGGTEFYDEKIVSLIEPYFIKQHFHYKKLSEEEINELVRTCRKKYIKLTEQETTELLRTYRRKHFKKLFRKNIKKIISMLKSPVSLKDEFFNVFLPSDKPRKNQDELWDIWDSICKNNTTYKGIIQWPTGTGKTIAILMLFVITANHCKQNGEIFRGLLISPKNDILDTIIHSFYKLSTWNIIICEGHHGRLSSVTIPSDKPILIITTHASLTEANNWIKLPKITHCHYDEVHRITGDELYHNLQTNLVSTPFLTGTSATPKTCNVSQHNKLYELFGTPISILHKCELDEAIDNKWIAKPRFSIHVLSNKSSQQDRIHSFVKIINASILKKQQKNWKGGKVIVYLSSKKDVLMAVNISKRLMPHWKIYTAIEDEDTPQDDLFVKDEADGCPRVLFACERYKEGSDIKGIEMTCILMGDIIGTHILLQIAGRALRNDYDEKEGWCIIVRPSEDHVTEDEVFDSIVLQIMDFMGKETPNKTNIYRIVEQFLGNVTVSGKEYDINETVQRIQAMYARDAFEKTPKEKYSIVRGLNQELGIKHKQTYKEKASEHPRYIEDPKDYFRNEWVSWYHYFGVDTSVFPPTKQDWVRLCKERGVTTWSLYKEKKYTDLPENPCDMYEDYTNWDKEFGIEEEILW